MQNDIDSWEIDEDTGLPIEPSECDTCECDDAHHCTYYCNNDEDD